MIDNQTQSYWAMMTHNAIGGPSQGTVLSELPISTKTTWGEWVGLHPDTQLLSVAGVTHKDNAYDSYFTSDETFRGAKATDTRLPDKTSLFSFSLADKSYGITHEKAGNGRVTRAGERNIFVYRPKDAAIYRSTGAWYLELKGKPVVLQQDAQGWFSPEHGRFSTLYGSFPNGELARVGGFDTFWYIWSEYHPGTELLE